MLKEAFLFLDKWTKINKLSFEIIIVDDGSSDNTTQIAIDCSLKHIKYVKVLKLLRNRGKGGATKSGVLRSKGKYVLMVDADGATDINDLCKIYTKMKLIQKNNKDGSNDGVSIGSR
jgi:dolichyl-phosphate beta-glucosyltransferase